MTQNDSVLLRVINSVAPIRICDNGGWTDTWFAEHGKVFNIAVNPYAEVQIEIYPKSAHSEPVTLFAENFGERYAFTPQGRRWERHPLLEAAIGYVGIPSEYHLNVTVFSDAPSGASTGTSAAVAVALIGALDRLTPGRLSPHEVAYVAHRIETETLGLESGIQDQLCAAYGGINFIEMAQYPYATVSPLTVSENFRQELERRLILIYLGKSHDSSVIHEKVIHDLEDAGPDSPQIEALRKTAEKSRDAVYANNFLKLGSAMIENTEAQRRLNPALISEDAQRVIDIAKEHGVIGWKVNGAGGEGGSVTLLANSVSHVKRTLIREIEEENSLFKHIPIYLNQHGLRTWESKHSETT